MALIFLLLSLLLSSLVDVEYVSVHPRGKAEALVFDLMCLATALVSALLLWPLSLCLLGVDRGALAHCCEEAEVLVFDLVDVAKALVQFEHSSEALVFNLDASPEATEQFEQATEVDKAFLGHFLRLRLDCLIVAFEHARAVASH